MKHKQTIISNCVWCKKEFIQPFNGKKKSCSTSCRSKYACSLRFKGDSASKILTKTCTICSIKFTYKQFPSSSCRETCSNSCGVKAAIRRKNPQSILAGEYEFKCYNVHCGKLFKRSIKSRHFIELQNGANIFCSKRCSADHDKGSHRNKEWYIAKWTKEFDHDEANKRWNELSEHRSALTSGENNAMYGQPRSYEVKKKVSDGVKKAYEEGRLTCNWGNSYGIINFYRNHRLRSMTERHAIIKLEERFDLELGNNLLYENSGVHIPWLDINGESHIYVPDLYDIKNQVVYEVKLECDLIDPDVQMKSQHVIIRLLKRDIQYKFITQSRIIHLGLEKSFWEPT